MPVVKNKAATTVSENGLQMIKTFEGLVLHVYKDKVGKWTIGYGTTHYENGQPVKSTDKPIKKERAEQLLRFEAQAKAYVLAQSLQKNKVSLNQNQFDALCSFSYNTGIAGLVGSTLFALISKGVQSEEVLRPHFMEWNKGHIDGKLVVISDLTWRRGKEADLYFKQIA